MNGGGKYMLKKCINCNDKISFKDFYMGGLLRGYYEYICPKCGAKHKVLKQSILIYFLAAVVPMGVLLKLNQKNLAFLWLIISISILQPLIFKFKKV